MPIPAQKYKNMYKNQEYQTHYFINKSTKWQMYNSSRGKVIASHLKFCFFHNMASIQRDIALHVDFLPSYQHGSHLTSHSWAHKCIFLCASVYIIVLRSCLFLTFCLCLRCIWSGGCVCMCV